MSFKTLVLLTILYFAYVQEHESGSVLDMHWSPVHSFCTPCQFNLTDIVLFETQDQDMEYILRKYVVLP